MPRPLYGYALRAGKVVRDPHTWAVVLGVLSAAQGGGASVVQRMTSAGPASVSRLVTRIRSHARFYREGRPYRGAAPDPRLSAAFALAGDPPEAPPSPPTKRIAKRNASSKAALARTSGQGRRSA